MQTSPQPEGNRAELSQQDAPSGQLSTDSCRSLGASLATKFASINYSPLTGKQHLIDLTTYSPEEQQAIVAGMVEKISRELAHASNSGGSGLDHTYAQQNFSALLALYLAGGDISAEFLRGSLVDPNRSEINDPLTDRERFDLRLLRWAEQIDGSPVYSNHQEFEKLIRAAQDQRYTDQSPQARWQLPVLILTDHGNERTGAELRALRLGNRFIENELTRLTYNLHINRNKPLWALASETVIHTARIIECAGVCQGIESDSAIIDNLACLDRVIPDVDCTNWIKTLFIASRSNDLIDPTKRAKLLANLTPDPEELIKFARQTLLDSYCIPSSRDPENEVIRTELGLALLSEARDKAASRGSALSENAYASLRREIVACSPRYRYVESSQQLAELRKDFVTHAIIAEDSSEAFQRAMQDMLIDMLIDRSNHESSRFPNQKPTELLRLVWPNLESVPEELKTAYERYAYIDLTADKAITLSKMFTDKITPQQAERWGRKLLENGQFDQGIEILQRHGNSEIQTIIRDAVLVLVVKQVILYPDKVRQALQQAYLFGVSRIKVPELLSKMQKVELGSTNCSRGEFVAPLLDLLDASSLLLPDPNNAELSCAQSLKNELVSIINVAVNKLSKGGSAEFYPDNKVRTLFKLIKTESEVRDTDPDRAREQLYAEYVATLRRLIRNNDLHESVLISFLESDTNLYPEDPHKRLSISVEPVKATPIDRRLLKHPIIELALKTALDSHSVRNKLEDIAKLEKEHIALVAPELSTTLVEDALLLRNAGYMAVVALARGKRADYEPYPRIAENLNREAESIVRYAQESIEKAIYPRKASVETPTTSLIYQTHSKATTVAGPPDLFYLQQVQDLVTLLPSCDTGLPPSLEAIAELALLQLQGIVTSDYRDDAQPKPWEGWQTILHLSLQERPRSIKALHDCFERSIETQHYNDAYRALATLPGGPTDAQRERLARVLLRKDPPEVADFWHAAELLSTRGSQRPPQMYPAPEISDLSNLYPYVARTLNPKQPIELPRDEISAALNEIGRRGQLNAVIRYDRALREAHITVDGAPICISDSYYSNMIPALVSNKKWQELIEIRNLHPNFRDRIATEVSKHITDGAFPSDIQTLDLVIDLAPTLRSLPGYKTAVLNATRDPQEVFKRISQAKLSDSECFDLVFASTDTDISIPRFYAVTPFNISFQSYPAQILNNEGFLRELIAEQDTSKLHRVAWTAAILKYPLKNNPVLSRIVADSQALAIKICERLTKGIASEADDNRQKTLTQAIDVANYFGMSLLAAEFSTYLHLITTGEAKPGTSYG